MRKSNTAEFIVKACKKHGVGTFDYSNSSYENATTKLEIGCPKHGSFWQTPNNHLNGKGCPKCRTEKAVEGSKKHRRSLKMATEGIELPINSNAISISPTYFTIVDEEMFESLSDYNWFRSGNRRNNTVYAMAKLPKSGRNILMHRLIMGVVDDPSVVVDHVNGNGLDNRRCNLRVCTPQQNAFNSKPVRGSRSKFKGVKYNTACKNKWTARIRINGKQVDIGRFETEEEAARAYDKAAKEIQGDFAWLNFPNE